MENQSIQWSAWLWELLSIPFLTPFLFLFAIGELPAELGQRLLGKFFSFILALRYLWRFQTIHFEKESFLLDIKESMKNLQHGNQQQLKPDCSYRDSNHSVQFVDLLRRINKIWNRYSISCLRNRYENKCHNPCDCCRNLAGNTADYRLQLWGKAIPSCTGGLPACGKMEPCCFHKLLSSHFNFSRNLSFRYSEMGTSCILNLLFCSCVPIFSWCW